LPKHEHANSAEPGHCDRSRDQNRPTHERPRRLGVLTPGGTIGALSAPVK
jgi:hypothetical protein